MRFFGNLVLGIVLTFIACCVIAGMVCFARWDLLAFNVLFNHSLLRVMLILGIIVGLYLGFTDGGDL